MKFQLFGRLKDDGEAPSEEDPGGDYQAMGGSPATESMQTGSSLERTVRNMFDQGYNETEIKNELGGQYNEKEIDDAINRTVADTAGGNSAGGPNPMSTYDGEGGATSPIDKGYNEDEEESMEPNGPPGEQTMSTPTQNSGGQQRQQQPARTVQADASTEELIETVVEEKMTDVMNEFQNTYAEIDELREQIEDLEDRVHDLEVRDDEDQEQFIRKVDEMEDHVDDYQSRIGGLEKAFQQVLPSLVENVQDLTELVQEIKDEKGIQTEGSVSNEEIENIDVEDW